DRNDFRRNRPIADSGSYYQPGPGDGCILYQILRFTAFKNIEDFEKLRMSKQTSGRRPLITVVIPTYNRLPLVQQAIASVLAQTYTNWELFVVDDGSDDGTPAAISSINDSRIKLVEMRHSGNIAEV